MKFENSKTKQNLARAFAAECQAGARYQFMATQAQMEKLVFIKDTMKMLAKNEMAHAKVFYDYIVTNGGDECKVEYSADYPFVQPTLDVSLKNEAQIERDEFKKIYPEFARIAEEEGFKDIAKSFRLVAKTEEIHAGILNKLYKGYTEKSLYKSKTKKVYKCSNCGHTEYASEGWKNCPLCGAPEGYIMIDFSEINTDCTCSEKAKK